MRCIPLRVLDVPDQKTIAIVGVVALRNVHVVLGHAPQHKASSPASGLVLRDAVFDLLVQRRLEGNHVSVSKLHRVNKSGLDLLHADGCLATEVRENHGALLHEVEHDNVRLALVLAAFLHGMSGVPVRFNVTLMPIRVERQQHMVEVI